MAENLLSYTGNAGLGLGSNPGIPAPDNVPLKQIGQTTRDILLLDNQWNVMKYQQQQKNQAELRDAIDKGQVAKGEILPEYQPAFDAARQKVTDYYKNNGQDLISNPEKYREYQSLVQDLKDVSTHAQVNTHGVQVLEAQKAKETIPTKQAEIQKFIDGQKAATAKDFWNQIKSYQQAHDMNIADVTDVSPKAFIKTTRQDPNDALKSYDRTVLDYDQILNEKVNDFLNDTTGAKADSQSKWLQKLQNYDPIELGKTLNNMDAQILKYNKERGLSRGMPGFVEPVKREARAGQLIIKESVPELAAKYALTNQPQFVTESPAKIDYKLGSLNVAEERANTDAAYKRIMAANSAARTNAYVQNTKSQMAARKKPEEQEQYMDEMYNRNLLNQKSLIAPYTGKGANKNRITFGNIPAESSLPVFTMQGSKVVQLPPIGAKAVKGPNNTISYQGGHYEPQYQLGGKTLNAGQLSDAYIDFKKKVGSKWTGSLDDYLKKQIQLGNIVFSIKGANGVTDRGLSRAAQRAISNLDTQKGEVGVFAPPEDSQIPDTPDNPIE